MLFCIMNVCLWYTDKRSKDYTVSGGKNSQSVDILQYSYRSIIFPLVYEWAWLQKRL